MIKTIFLILIFSIVSNGQDIYKPPCYEKDNVIPGQVLDLVLAELNLNLKINKKFDIIYLEDKSLYIYKEIVWRIEYKNIKLNCKYEKNQYYDNDIKVNYDGQNTSVTDINIYSRLLLNK